MLAKLGIIVAVVAICSAGSSPNATKEKRGVSGPWAAFNVGTFNGFEHQDVQQWSPALAVVAQPLWDEPPVDLGQVQLQAVHNLALQALVDHHRPGTHTIAYSPEIMRAIHYAKEANYQVQLAQQRVAAAKEAVVSHERFALAKQAAAREAAQRSAEITANAEAEARASARQLVALQQRLATLKDTVAAAQRVAAARENAAAAAIQRNAQDTAAELKKQDVDRQISQSEREAKARDIVATKENIISQGLHNNAGHKHNPWG